MTRKEKDQGKRKNDCEDEKKKTELEWKHEDCAQPLGDVSKITGERQKKKNHFKAFKFHDKHYKLEDSVLLVSEDPDRKPYIAIIKDIYIPNKEKYVKLEVQWFYRPEDVDKKSIGNWESKGTRSIFYSFHRDEVFAESVEHKCIVNFVPEDKQIPNRREHPGFIVQEVYDIVKKKLRKLSDDDFDVHQKQEIDHLVAETVLRVGALPDIGEENQTTKTSSCKGSVRKRYSRKAETTSPKTRLKCKSILEDFELLTGNLDRDKTLDELLKAFKHKCRTTKKHDGKSDYYWPDDVVPVVRALEQVLHDSFGEDMSKHKQKLEILTDELKISRVLAWRILGGELKLNQVITMTQYELKRGFTFDEITVDLDE
ncbi:PREDICTED: uncharacterized protein LOC104713975 [Camelina sativa]|uniref:Uncharacterized protein LOC104713975 n=1 Tax=Camelina sativa TaxID=90675 RepID=A0ABM1QGD7_CAMSA|nr:PREDICTED: uncharacterized protein LOC104713975 [Camelina sativa]